MNLGTNNKIQKKGITLVIPNPCGNIKETKMKNSGIEWIGEIPDDWESIRLKYIYSTTKAKLPKQFYDDKNLTPYLSMDFIRDSINTEPVYAKDGDYCSEEDILILWDGSNAGEIVFNHPAGYAPSTTAILKKLSTQSLPVYDKFYLKALEDDLRRNTNGMGIPHVNGSYLNNSLFLLPPKSTQQCIATYLDKKCSKIEETIQNQQQVIEKLKAYKQSLITEAVTGKVKIENGKVCGEYESYKDSGVEWIGKIPSGWEVKKLKYIADSFSKGSGITKEEIVINGDTPCVRYGELYTKYDYHFTECQTRTNLGIIETPKYFSHGDVLFTCTGELVEEIGKSIAYLGNEKCLAGGDIIVLKHSQDPMFMGFALDSKYVQGQKSFGKTKLKVVHISSGEIARLLIVLPPKEEQKEIADYLDKKCTAIDTVIEQKQNLIEKLTEYKKSLIYECVTGKKEV